MPEPQKNFQIALQGDANTMTPKRINQFLISTNPEGVYVDCIYNTKQADQNNVITAYVVQRMFMNAPELKDLADTIYRHLRETGYIEPSASDSSESEE